MNVTTNKRTERAYSDSCGWRGSFSFVSHRSKFLVRQWKTMQWSRRQILKWLVAREVEPRHYGRTLAWGQIESSFKLRPLCFRAWCLQCPLGNGAQPTVQWPFLSGCELSCLSSVLLKLIAFKHRSYRTMHHSRRGRSIDWDCLACSVVTASSAIPILTCVLPLFLEASKGRG
jgi:hypothetical protein